MTDNTSPTTQTTDVLTTPEATVNIELDPNTVVFHTPLYNTPAQ